MEVIRAQGVLVGDPFGKRLVIGRGNRTIGIPQRRLTRLSVALNEITGDMVITPARLVPVVIALDGFPHVSLLEGRIFDRARQRPRDLNTALKMGASTPGVDTEGEFQKRGAIPHYKIPKRGGFGFKSTPRELTAERKRQKLAASQTIFYHRGP